MNMNYRKKPVIIQAVQWDGKNLDDILWLDQPDRGRVATYGDTRLRIKTLEGAVLASIGDFLIKGVKGELYPCKPDIFEETYEKV